MARQWGEEIPIGVIYRNDRPPFDDYFPVLTQGPLFEQAVNQDVLKKIMGAYR
jgi:2-oxoglutarate ferredoxin oxidoreductase subunit beta